MPGMARGSSRDCVPPDVPPRDETNVISVTLLIIFVLALAVAAGSDVIWRRIPNAVTVTAFGVALVLRGFAGDGALGEGLLGAALALAVVLPIFAMRGMGGGDAKLLIMVGAFLGPGPLVVAMLATALAGGAMAVIAAARGGFILPALAGTAELALWVISFGRRGARRTLESPGAVSVPYGVAIAIGSALALFVGGGL